MALVLKDRVQETATANTTVSFTMTGAVTGFQSFSSIGNTNTTYYSAIDFSGNWETGIGTYSTTGPTLTRTTILSSSNSGSAVTFSGTVNVFVTYPATKSVNQDASGNVGIGTTSPALPLTVSGGTAGANFDGLAVFNSAGSGTLNSAATLYLSSANGITRSGYIQAINSSGSTNAHDLAFGTSSGSTAPAERMRIDSVGRLLLRTDTAYATVAATTAITPQVQLSGVSLASSSIGQFAWNTNPYYTFNKSGGALGTYTAVTSGIGLGVIQFNGSDGSAFVGSSSIIASADAAGTTGIVAGRLGFFTANSSGTLTERIRIDSSGYVGINNTSAACALDVTGGIQTSRTAVTSPATTDGNIFSGTYTPTFTNTTNISSSTPVVLYYTRVGNVVSVHGRVDVTATAVGNTVLGVSLPIASNLSTNAQLSGMLSRTSTTVANNTYGQINGDTTNKRALLQWNSTATTAFTYSINFSYVIV